ncbi:MAG: proteasome subunit alpha, partial [Actinomycetota bacterium]|nr:proteasome subunit alpha [Actinomycetota bacterium]
VDEHRFVAIGGESDELAGALQSRYEEAMPLERAVEIGSSVLAGAAKREIPPGDLEVSGLSHQRPRRKFFRIDEDAIAEMVART